MGIKLKCHEQTPSKKFIIEKIIIKDKDKDKKPYKKKKSINIYSIKLIILLSII